MKRLSARLLLALWRGGYIAIALGMIGGLALGLSSCASMNFDSALGATSVAIETLANRVADACGAPAPGGDCAPAPIGQISNETRDRMKATLQEAQDAFRIAVNARIAGDTAGAASSLRAASTILDALEVELTRRVMEGNP